MEELPDQLKDYIIVTIHKIGDKIHCNNYRGISLLSTSYKILPNIHLLSRPYIHEIIGDHQCLILTYPHSSDTGKKVGVKLYSTSDIYRFQGSL
jgi:hypothetical protein